jgi:hypothetical protein
MSTVGSPCQAAETAIYEALCEERPDVSITTTAPGKRSRYVADHDQNLISTVPWNEIEPDFAEGAGHELAGDLCAPWSSAALAANSFGAWASAYDRLAIGVHTGFQGRPRFERRFPTGLPGTAPHLDWLGLADDGIVAIESKSLEFVCSPKLPRFQASYTTGISDFRAESQWGKLISADLSGYWRLDVGQLVRHALGLMSSGSRYLAGTYVEVPGIAEDTPITLILVYFEPSNADHPVWEQLRAELDTLSAAVCGDSHVQFDSVSYPQLWAQWADLEDPPAWLAAHLDQLRGRYLVHVPV